MNTVSTSVLLFAKRNLAAPLTLRRNRQNGRCLVEIPRRSFTPLPNPLSTNTKRLSLLFALSAVLVANTSAQVSPDMVYIGNLGNSADSRTGFGTVNYGYSIGSFEVTVSQYCAFLNAVGADDTYGLYSILMGYPTLTGGGILRDGTAGGYTYSVAGSGQRPISCVTWFDAARFVNWMSNGQPIGGQGAGTTETGSYTLNGATSGPSIARNTGPGWVLPSANEWYKAAYYSPGAYNLYPTFSNTQPNSRYGSTTDPNSANYFYNDGIDNGYNGGYAVNNSTSIPNEYQLTDVGAFTLARSYYGTFGQAGNVSEWSDSVQTGDHLLLGGNWYWTYLNNRSTSFSINASSEIETTQFGIRLAYVPEPSTLALLVLSAATLRLSRKGSR